MEKKMTRTVSTKAKLVMAAITIIMAMATSGAISSDAHAMMKADPDSCTDGFGTVVCDFSGPYPW